MAKPKYHLHLKGYVGGWDFDSDYVDYIVDKYKNETLNVLIDSTGGYVGTALSVAAAFRRHGDVHVHFVGLNASAATLASLGAKHISIDKDAMYLVHKCSTYFFEWGSKNADQYEQLIKDVTKVKEDLDKFDQNAARQYASRCKRKPEDMLALMAKGGWLTAQDALDWGFVDEITQNEEDSKAIQVTENLLEAMAEAGYPVPQGYQSASKEKNPLLNALLKMLSNPFKRDKGTEDNKVNEPENSEPEIQEPEADEEASSEDETKTNPIFNMKAFKFLCAVLAVEALTLEEKKFTLSEEQLDKIEDALSEKDTKIKDLNEEKTKLENKVKELEAKLDNKPGEETSQVVDNKGKTSQKSEMESYVEDWNKSKEVFDSLPD